ncbi:MAG: hypothetical protein RR860_00955, partial [Janthinobacterium sp.]
MGTTSMFLEGATRGMQAGMAEIITHFFKAWRLLQKNLRHIGPPPVQRAAKPHACWREPAPRPLSCIA